MENQFPLAPGVAGVDDVGDVRAFEQALEQVEAGLGLLDRLELEVVGDDREVREAPLAALLVHLARQAQLDEVADGGSHDVIVVLEIIVLLRNLAQHSGQIGGNTRLFCDNEGF